MASAFAGDETAPFFGPPSSSPVSGVWVASMGVMRPELVMKPIVPVIEAGVLGSYGLIIDVIIGTGTPRPSPTTSLMAIPTSPEGSGGQAGLSARMTIEIVELMPSNQKLFVGMILILIFAEALALYGLCWHHLVFPCCSVQDRLGEQEKKNEVKS